MAEASPESLDKVELVRRVRELEALLAARERQEAARAVPGGAGPAEAKPRRQRKFDMSKYRQRHIALHIAYDGREYSGLAFQEGLRTVEGELFAALEKCCLIADRGSCNFSRCGRTDKGVSAAGQVVALHLRSKLRAGAAFVDGDASADAAAAGVDAVGGEIDYPQKLNQVLPAAIRVLGWAAVPAGFSARFSCVARRYRYFFARRDLNVERMRAAARQLVGEHDFRNFCKMDVVNVSNFVREIYSFEIRTHSAFDGDPRRDVLFFDIHGSAFLWHQVRLMAAVLFLVGQGKEGPEVVAELLDVGAHPRRPAFEMADDAPLVLHKCSFPGLRFHLSEHAARTLTASLEERWWAESLAATQTLDLLRLSDDAPVRRQDGSVARWGDIRPALPSRRPQAGSHRPLLKRPLRASYEEALETLSSSKAKRRREVEKKAKHAKEAPGMNRRDRALHALRELAGAGAAPGEQ